MNSEAVTSAPSRDSEAYPQWDVRRLILVTVVLAAMLLSAWLWGPA